MRLARETSSTAVRSGTLPISRRYMRTGSLEVAAHAEVDPGAGVVGGGRGRPLAQDLDVQVGQDLQQRLVLLLG